MSRAGRDGVRVAWVRVAWVRVAWVRVVASAALVAVVASACGGGDPRQTRTEFITQADAQCATLASASEELGLAQAEGAAGKAVQGYVRAAAEGLRTLARGLDDLAPPVSLDADLRDLVGALDEYADGLDEIAARVKPAQGLRDTLDAAPRTVARLNRIADRATKRVVDLGLQGCQLSG